MTSEDKCLVEHCGWSGSDHSDHARLRHPELLHDCGYMEGTFACRIRHINIAPMESSSNVSRWDRAAEKHGNQFGRDVRGKK